ncbi:MAG: hypothetical protein NVS2B8_13680 [Vulcanimicrobiaceae bacterium]
MTSGAGEIALVSIVTVSVALLLAQTVLRYCYGYALTQSHFEVRLFDRVPIVSIRLEEIARVSVLRFSPKLLVRSFVTLSLGNRVFGTRLAIELDRRFPRYLIVTPDDPLEMLETLNRRIASSLASSRR